jgi:hypothetical protein
MSLVNNQLWSTQKETRAFAMQRRGKHASTTIELLLEKVLCNPLLGSRNSWTTTMEMRVFSVWSVPRSYHEDNWGDPVSYQLWVEFCTGGCDKRTRAREAEESPLLEAVASERLVKTWQAGKGLAGAVVICKVWRSAVALKQLVVSRRVYRWSINSFTNPNPVYSHP